LRANFKSKLAKYATEATALANTKASTTMEKQVQYDHNMELRISILKTIMHIQQQISNKKNTIHKPTNKNLPWRPHWGSDLPYYLP
jgi:hypothetical protein